MAIRPYELSCGVRSPYLTQINDEAIYLIPIIVAIFDISERLLRPRPAVAGLAMTWFLLEYSDRVTHRLRWEIKQKD